MKFFNSFKNSKNEYSDINGGLDGENNKGILTSISEKPVRKIIDGYLYDTSKSKKIIVKNVLGPFMNTQCALFMTPNNRFFTVDSFANVRVLIESEAKEFISEYPDKYQEIFGKVEEA